MVLLLLAVSPILACYSFIRWPTISAYETHTPWLELTSREPLQAFSQTFINLFLIYLLLFHSFIQIKKLIRWFLKSFTYADISRSTNFFFSRQSHILRIYRVSQMKLIAFSRKAHLSVRKPLIYRDVKMSS